jgi:hypothetical protein
MSMHIGFLLSTRSKTAILWIYVSTRLANYLESEFYDGGDFVCGMFSMCFHCSWPISSWFLMTYIFCFCIFLFNYHVVYWSRKVCRRPYFVFVFLNWTRTMEKATEQGISLINQNDTHLVQRNRNSDSSDEVRNFL